jgi:hypothetical protein
MLSLGFLVRAARRGRCATTFWTAFWDRRVPLCLVEEGGVAEGARLRRRGEADDSTRVDVDDDCSASAAFALHSLCIGAARRQFV